ncbi:glycosyltransferase family 2 protein [Oceanobacillus oncorhynchi]|uniref:glycosyltransferase family 2 protein n=1 Tax=Oceanobacillus oncorhynchi TaxID=545501 RepID=UPI0018677693|nr:glycosyltransferase family 2 protein [Oceanobacillus oncorhynchi]
MEEPLVSVIIPFYSGRAWLEEAILSVQHQTYKNLEVLIVNDGSKEDIDGVLDKFRLNIHLIKKENEGPASARNLGIEKATGKYIAFLDSDDLWLPEKLRQQITFMENSDVVWSQHSYRIFWENSAKTKNIYTNAHTGNVLKDCYISFKVQTSCVVVLKDILIENNIRFPVNKRYGQDLDFYKQIAKDYPLGYIDNINSKFRVRGTNAGFRAKVQLNDKAAVWKEIKQNKFILNILPKPVQSAYKISYIFSNLIRGLDKYMKNDRDSEFIYKGMYIFPYSIFKLYSNK